VRARDTGQGERVEVPLLAAALAVQMQDLVWLEGEAGDQAPRLATRADLEARADEIALGLATNPYYRCYEAADGYLALACLNLAQREALLGLFGLDDPTIDAPDLIPADAALLGRKRALTDEIAVRIAREPVAWWLELCGGVGVPCGPVFARETVHADPQARANLLLQEVAQDGLGLVTMLGRIFRFGDEASGAVGPAPALGADTEAVLAELGAG